MIIRYDQDELRDIAIRIMDKLIEANTRLDEDRAEENDWYIQDDIVEVLRRSLNGKTDNE